MIPVLCVSDTKAARAALERLFGFSGRVDGEMSLGDQRIFVGTSAPDGTIPLRLDHLALRVGDAAAAMETIASRGGMLSGAFTPDGPREIAEFWDRGVRFVFFDGPEGWPFEFCERIGSGEVASGHDHYGLRTPDPDALEARLIGMGAARVAAHILNGTPPVRVRFLSLGQEVFEIFDEGPFPVPDPRRGFIGLMPE